MRLQNNRARGPFQQLRLAIQCSLTCRLYVLYYRIERIKSNLEVSQTTLLAHHIYSNNSSQLAIDEQQLRIASSESVTRTSVPSPAAGIYLLCILKMIANHFSAATAALANDVVDPTPAIAALPATSP